jgi:UDPglucose 6-dehydrogenase
VVGAGYVGLVTAAALAESGRDVRVVEVDEARRTALREGRSPIHEPGLDELLGRLVAAGSLSVADDVATAMDGAGIAMVAVGTPPLADGHADLTQVRAAVRSIVAAAGRGVVVVIKSSVPPGTTRDLPRLLGLGADAPPVVVCPEFLREGNALEDVGNPSRIVVGGGDAYACARVMALFAHLPGRRITTDATSAEMIKYGANSFLALKISFINEIAHLCELAGADVQAVADGIGADPRIGRAFLNAGLGFGGSCFPKDVRALEETAGYHGHSFWLLKAAAEVNALQRRRFVARVQELLGGRLAGRRIAVLGVAFKPGTDDMRQAVSIDIVRHLQDLGAQVVATDPVALGTAAACLPATPLVGDPYACVRGADAVLLVTEWPEYARLDWARIATLVRRRVVVDGRNLLDGEALVEHGFTYAGVGRPVLRPKPVRALRGSGQRRPQPGTPAVAAERLRRPA